ncbi:hypothetical protein BPO_0317 [Bergeyella porcorum]|uniref:Uncharacterized protein n=1 Tax=Bergeyella porcorum TaxID=1735111 RepID=A0AAU0EZY6_9FLAO
MIKNLYNSLKTRKLAIAKAFSVQRSAFSVQRSAFSVQRSYLDKFPKFRESEHTPLVGEASGFTCGAFLCPLTQLLRFRAFQSRLQSALKSFFIPLFATLKTYGYAASKV